MPKQKVKCSIHYFGCTANQLNVLINLRNIHFFPSWSMTLHKDTLKNEIFIPSIFKGSQWKSVLRKKLKFEPVNCILAIP